MDVWIFIALAILLGFVLLFILKRKKSGFSFFFKKRYQSYWQKINGIPDKRHAVLEADKLLDALLKHKGYSGSLGEKLKAADECFNNIDQVWRAHKLRNRLAHEMDFAPPEKDLRGALQSFYAAYKDLGLFD